MNTHRNRRGRYTNLATKLERIVGVIVILLILLYSARSATAEHLERVKQLRHYSIDLQVQLSEVEHQAALSSNTINDPSKWAIIHTAKATAYSCNGLKTDAEILMNCPNGITTSGTIPQVGRTIACPIDMLGRVLEIKGLGTRVCEDTGGAITTGRIDVYMNHVDIARNYGVQKITYKVLQ